MRDKFETHRWIMDKYLQILEEHEEIQTEDTRGTQNWRTRGTYQWRTQRFRNEELYEPNEDTKISLNGQTKKWNDAQNFQTNDMSSLYSE